MRYPGQRLRVLFLCARIGDGHVRAAQAMAVGLQHAGLPVATRIFDPFEAACPHLVHIGVAGYVGGIWGRVPPRDGAEPADNWAWRLFAALATRPLLREVTRFRPHVLVSTYAPISRLIAALGAEGRDLPPALGVLTDFTALGLGSRHSLEYYLAPTCEAAVELTECGWDARRIEVCGIPIDPGFRQSTSQARARQLLGLRPELPTVLLMNGGAGVGGFRSALLGLEQAGIQAQAVVVAGRNRRALRALRDRRSARLTTLAFGHVPNVSLLMDAADFLVGKPGGLTAAESLVKGLPLICAHALPGAEQRNLEALVRWGAAVAASDSDDVGRAAREWFVNAPSLARYRAQALRHARPDAAFQAAQAILRLAGIPALPPLDAALPTPANSFRSPTRQPLGF